MPTQGERIATLENGLNNHESRCEERLKEIKAVASETREAVKGLQARSWALVIAILAWALAQLWVATQDRIERIEDRPAAVSK